jgi:WhiB family transcriptional regulator, redox-sensing transcriptional regulator
MPIHVPMSATVEAIAGRDHWARLALCASHPDRTCWFSDDHEAMARAIATCRVCPVRIECLTFAVTTGQSFGVWGGTMPSERRRLMRASSRAQ